MDCLSQLGHPDEGFPPAFSELDMRSNAALHLPINIKLAKERARLVLALADSCLGSLCCRVLPSITNSSKSPFDQVINLFKALDVVFDL